jgi:hypothetical protein
MIDNLSVCVDCAMILANGELGQGDEAAEREHGARMAEQWPDPWVLVLDINDDDAHFSWQDCDGCGSRLGGDRLDASAYEREVVSHCPVCGDVIDYCQGHGQIGDPQGFSIMNDHDNDEHQRCHPQGCADAHPTDCADCQR